MGRWSATPPRNDMGWVPDPLRYGTYLRAVPVNRVLEDGHLAPASPHVSLCLLFRYP